MSCDTQSQQSVNLSVSIGALPEGYCPASWSQFAQDIANRLMVTTVENQAFFVSGDVEPQSNVGPWLKNCEEWWVFDDELGIYRPITKQGFNTIQLLSSGSGDFTVPEGIYKLRVQLWGGGGGGWGNGGTAEGGGGGGGGYSMAYLDVQPGDTLAYAVGTGGAGGSSAAAGGNTTFASVTANGGTAGGSGTAGIGGTGVGGTLNITGGPSYYFNAGNGGDGGISPRGGPGGRHSSGGANAAGIVPGGGGAGGYSTFTAGAGANGLIIVEY